MASVLALLDRVRDQAWRLTAADEQRQPPARRDWAALAGQAGRVLGSLDAGPLSIVDTLAQMSHSPDSAVPVSDSSSARALGGMATALGAIGDILASHEGLVARAPAAERIRLASNIQAVLYTVARWGLKQPGVDPVTRDHLNSVAQQTETSALLPPQSRLTAIDHLTISGPTGSSLSSATARWADQALTTLHDSPRLSGYAFQSIAGTIALLSQATVQVMRHARVPDRDSVVALQRASEAWRASSAWPPHVRLAGSSPGLRAATQQLAAALVEQERGNGAAARPLERLLVLQDGLHAAKKVASAHRSALTAVVDHHHLWVAASTLSPRYRAAHPEVRTTGWVRHNDSAIGQQLLASVITANTATEAALPRLDAAVSAMSTLTVPAHADKPVNWETISPPATPNRGRRSDASPDAVGGSPAPLRVSL